MPFPGATVIDAGENPASRVLTHAGSRTLITPSVLALSPARDAGHACAEGRGGETSNEIALPGSSVSSATPRESVASLAHCVPSAVPPIRANDVATQGTVRTAPATGCPSAS